MALAVTEPIAALASSTNTSSYAMTAFTPTANSLLLVYVYLSGSISSNVSMSGGGLTWVKHSQSVAVAGSQISIYLFYALVGASPVSTTATFTTDDAATGAIMALLSFTGHNASNPFAQVKADGSTANANAPVNFDSPLLPSNAYAAFWSTANAGFNSNTLVSPPSGWTESDEVFYTTPNAHTAVAYRNGGLSTTGPFPFTHTAVAWFSFWVEVNDAANGSVVARNFLTLLGVG